MKAVLEEIYGTADFRGKRVLMQGVGAVGGPLAVMLQEQGAEVIICDVNEKRVEELRAEHGFRVVPDAGHQRIECEIYAPCARGAVLNDETIPQLRCKAVAGCANNQLLDTRHAQVLKDRGILYAPDYVLNAGGIINVSVELLPGGYVEETSLRKIAGIYTNLKKVFEVSRAKNVTTLDAAARIAEERLRGAPARKV
jgi:leucine dehydrogenase